jgi:hypothetical protein
MNVHTAFHRKNGKNGEYSPFGCQLLLENTTFSTRAQEHEKFSPLKDELLEGENQAGVYFFLQVW